MALAAIATDVLETLNVLLHLPPKRSLDDEAGLDDRRDLADILVRQFAGSHLTVDARQRPQRRRECDPDGSHGSVWTSTEDTLGRYCAIASHVSPASADT